MFLSVCWNFEWTSRGNFRDYLREQPVAIETPAASASCLQMNFPDCCLPPIQRRKHFLSDSAPILELALLYLLPPPSPKANANSSITTYIFLPPPFLPPQLQDCRPVAFSTWCSYWRFRLPVSGPGLLFLPAMAPQNLSFKDLQPWMLNFLFNMRKIKKDVYSEHETLTLRF